MTNNSLDYSFRLVVNFSDKAVSRVRVLERGRDGKWVPIERPWGIKLLAALKLAKKAATLASDGVADLNEICRTASAPRRRKVGKKRMVEGALQTARPRRPDKDIAHNE